MLQTVKGVYRNGKIELTEIPQNILESQVLITFIETTTPENIVVKSFAIGVTLQPALWSGGSSLHLI